MPPKRSRNSKSKQMTARKVKRVLRRDHLTEGATWYQIRTRNTDPPTYTVDAQYQRKIRLRLTLPITGGDITIATIASQFVAAFSFIKIKRVDIYGHADSNSIACIARIPASPVIMTKRFTDTGVEGSRRPHIAIELAEQHNNFMPTNAPAIPFTLYLLNELGVGIIGTVIADFQVSLLGDKGIPLTNHGITHIILPSKEESSEVPDVSSIQLNK
jgi:hypothetical protein